MNKLPFLESTIFLYKNISSESIPSPMQILKINTDYLDMSTIILHIVINMENLHKALTAKSKRQESDQEYETSTSIFVVLNESELFLMKKEQLISDSKNEIYIKVPTPQLLADHFLLLKVCIFSYL